MLVATPETTKPAVASHKQRAEQGHKSPIKISSDDLKTYGESDREQEPSYPLHTSSRTVTACSAGSADKQAEKTRSALDLDLAIVLFINTKELWASNSARMSFLPLGVSSCVTSESFTVAPPSIALPQRRRHSCRALAESFTAVFA